VIPPSRSCRAWEDDIGCVKSSELAAGVKVRELESVRVVSLLGMGRSQRLLGSSAR